MKYLPIEEFKERGYLQEANRLFFHPLGIALVVSVDNDSGNMKLSGVQDNRDDPEGMIFDNYDHKKAAIIWDEAHAKIEARAALGCCSWVGTQVRDYIKKDGDGTKS